MSVQANLELQPATVPPAGRRQHTEGPAEREPQFSVFYPTIWTRQRSSCQQTVLFYRSEFFANLQGMQAHEREISFDGTIPRRFAR